ncbi:hypothetical protein BFN03_17150 [Rhodococcus sp. WMMA185]|uniref:hypothetical protein n=1 Tax=Rhodococcus sp. WMMA185 TaxID=679318 RepID=UPI00087874F1|nr:hypothetical protein [Rhodococcus sp. WMMA185]AOW93796.1 hypothetical protein BFN03_17150 [Rhodococcus sp. WMMA185]
MSGDSVKVEHLNDTAQILARNAEEVEELGVKAPNVPNAGPSTALVGDALVELAQAMSFVAQASANAADAVQASDANYAATDQANSRQLSGVGEHIPETSGGGTR